MNQIDEPVSNSKISKQFSNKVHQRKWLIALTLLFLSVGIIYFLYWFFYSSYYQYTDNAYVNGNIMPITSQVTGNVIAVKVNDTQAVKKGQLLLQLDKTDSLIALEKAKTNLALTVRKIKQIFIKNEALKAITEVRQLNLERADKDFKRRKQAISMGAVSKEELSHAQEVFKASEANLKQAEASLDANKALTAGVTVAHHPEVKKAIAQLKQAYLNYLRTSIYAPSDGYIARKTAQIGQRITPGQLLMSLIPLRQVWVEANFKEKQLGQMKIGQKVKLTADFYGSNVYYQGWIVGFAAGTGSAFSLLPAQNATGNWIKIVQRLPVRIALDSKELTHHPLRIGLSMEATVDTYHLLTQDNHKLKLPEYSTSIFDNLLNSFNQEIDKIVKDNLESGD